MLLVLVVVVTIQSTNGSRAGVSSLHPSQVAARRAEAFAATNKLDSIVNQQTNILKNNKTHLSQLKFDTPYTLSIGNS